MSTRLRVGMGDSYGLRAVVLANPDFDPLLPTGVTFEVTKPSGASVSWIGTLGAPSSLSRLATYPFASDGSDLDEVGTWRVWLQWVVPGASPGPRTETASFIVVAANSV